MRYTIDRDCITVLCSSLQLIYIPIIDFGYYIGILPEKNMDFKITLSDPLMYDFWTPLIEEFIHHENYCLDYGKLES